MRRRFDRVRRLSRCSIAKRIRVVVRLSRPIPNILPRDPIRGYCQGENLTEAVHLSKNNAVVLRPAQRGQTPRVERKGKHWLDLDVQYA